MRPPHYLKWEFSSEQFSSFWWSWEMMRIRFGLILKITVRTKSYAPFKLQYFAKHPIHERNYHSFQDPTPIIPVYTILRQISTLVPREFVIKTSNHTDFSWTSKLSLRTYRTLDMKVKQEKTLIHSRISNRKSNRPELWLFTSQFWWYNQEATKLASVLFSAFFANIFGGGSASPSARTRIGRIFCARKRE